MIVADSDSLNPNFSKMISMSGADLAKANSSIKDFGLSID